MRVVDLEWIKLNEAVVLDKFWVEAIKMCKTLLFDCWCWATWLWLQSCRKSSSTFGYIRDNSWTRTLSDCRMSQFIHHVWEKHLLFMMILVEHGERSFSLQINITKVWPEFRVTLFPWSLFLCILLLFTVLW